MKFTAPKNGNGYKEMLKAIQSRTFQAFIVSKPAQVYWSPWDSLVAWVSEDKNKSPGEVTQHEDTHRLSASDVEWNKKKKNLR